ncbi:hypothetical protein EDC04DRAFT_2701256 [Pisolithus marmoratus]|nr:hypothetical protein EDC04DRAFT_2701256 [Pisolithus marmoratus]
MAKKRKLMSFLGFSSSRICNALKPLATPFETRDRMETFASFASVPHNARTSYFISVRWVTPGHQRSNSEAE